MALPVQTFPDPTQQYIRAFTLLVSNSQGQGIDLSALRVKFQVKQSSAETPNEADIRIYNLSRETAVKVQSEYTGVVIQAGYSGNYGVIFKGNIKQVIIGRESATDTFVDIIAGDGDLFYNYAIVNTTIAKNSTQQDQVNACIKSGSALGVTAGANSLIFGTPSLPRGKTMFGNTRNYLRDSAQTANMGWSIQNGQLVFVPLQKYLPGTAVQINEKTGMIGTPQQTNEGVNVKCLINPLIQISGRIQLQNYEIARLRINLTLNPNLQTNTAAPLASNGIYYVLAMEHTGDTRGLEWYTKLICLYTSYLSVYVDQQGNVS
jgi:hypothetical protein